MNLRRILVGCFSIAVCSTSLRPAWADPPQAVYVFPAGGQRGTTVEARIGGLCLHGECPLAVLGAGVEGPKTIRETDTVWFEGPVIPLPASQRKEDYPRDHAARLTISPDASPGVRRLQTWTSQGASPSLKFVVGDVPEVVEQETDDPDAPAVAVTLPVTVNGRIFPREDVDVWEFDAPAGRVVTCTAAAQTLGSPLEVHLEILDPDGRRVAEADAPTGRDPTLRFTPIVEGRYRLKIHDLEFGGLQQYIYRVTLTTDPVPSGVYPLGGRRGTATEFELLGLAVPAPRVSIELPKVPVDHGPVDHAQAFEVDGRSTPVVWLEIDDLPEVREAEGDAVDLSAGNKAELPNPGVWNGRIRKAGEVDEWKVRLTKGSAVEFALRAARLGSPLDGELTLWKEDGQQTAKGERLPTGDARLRFKPPADGWYTLKVNDRFASRGGDDFAYRIRVTEGAGPGFRLTLPSDGLSVDRGQSLKLKLDVQRDGYNGPVKLSVVDLQTGEQPAWIKLTGDSMGANKPNTQLTLAVDAGAKVGAVRLRLVGEGELEGRKLKTTAELPGLRGETAVDSFLLGVGLPTPFKVVGEYALMYAPRGSVFTRHYRLERTGYDGPVTVRLGDRQARHLQGISGPTITVPAGASEFDYSVSLPPWMEIGRTSRTVVMALAEVPDETGALHRVSYTSMNQNEQIVILVDPGLLSLTLDRSTLEVRPGAVVHLDVRLEQAPGLSLPVTFEWQPPAGFSSSAAILSPVTLPAGQQKTRLTFTLPSDSPLPVGPSLLRATAQRQGRRLVAESRLELVSP